MSEKYEINGNAYRELLYFCLQYHDFKEEIEDITHSGAARYATLVKNKGYHSDPTASKGERIARLSSKCELIEQTAIEVDDSIYQALINNVTTRITYEQMKACGIEILCGRRQFYEKRRKFFYLLNIKKG